MNVDIVADADGAGAAVAIGFAAAGTAVEVSFGGSGGLQCDPDGVVVPARDFAAGEQLALHVAFVGERPQGDLGVFVRGSFAGVRKDKVVAHRVAAPALGQKLRASRGPGRPRGGQVILPAQRR